MTTAQIQIPKKLKPVFAAKNIRYRGAYGGRGSAKTRTFAKMTAVKAYQFAESGVSGVILCGREYMNSLEDSSMEEVKQAIRSEEWLNDYFEIGEKFIRTKNHLVTYVFCGLRYNLDSIKSKARILLAWVDEAESVSEMAWQKLTPTVREENSEIWVTWNPEIRESATDARFRQRPPEDAIIVELNYSDNPWFPAVLENERLNDKRNLDPEIYSWIWEGAYLEDTERAVIKPAWIKAAIDAHITLGIKLSGKKRIGFDIADDGDDKCANVYAHGSVALWSDEWKAKEDEILKSCSRTYQKAREYNALIIYDSIGVGASAGNKFSELNKDQRNRIKYYKFNAGDKVFEPDKQYQQGVTNADFFANLKAQAWWSVADRFRNTYNAINKGEKFKDDELISIASNIPNLDRLKYELSTPHRDYDNNGRVKVESKKDLAKRGVKSPNVADAFIMAFAPSKVYVDYKDWV